MQVKHGVVDPALTCEKSLMREHSLRSKAHRTAWNALG